MKKKKIVIFTGAGMSAESGLATFRGSNGLWNGYNVYEVATPEAWVSNQKLVLDFYNMRRREIEKAKPNQAHFALAELENQFEVRIITQNIDDLHERAGSSSIIHLHGEITKVCDSIDKTEIFDWGFQDLQNGVFCSRGSQLRPFIVWFGEEVPTMDEAIKELEDLDAFVVIGTSLQVYPAANLCHYVADGCPIFYINPDPLPSNFERLSNVHQILETATSGVKQLKFFLNS